MSDRHANCQVSIGAGSLRTTSNLRCSLLSRLEDLYSLLHFLRLEPWGNYSFFRSFVTVPFEKKDPKAIEVIQVVLESIREFMTA